jgi:DNA-binding XRE family transcriptional regulator
MSNKMSLDQFKTKHYGKKGTESRDDLESGYQSFKISALIKEARLEKKLTQEELALKSGISRSFISKIENDAGDISISVLQKIIEQGLNGSMEFQIRYQK